jgi:hypothetical protein
MMDKIDYNGKTDNRAIYKNIQYERLEGEWTLYRNTALYDYVRTIADTAYRLRIADGNENYSGSTLHIGLNRRKEYKESYNVFLECLTKNGIKYAIVQGYRRAQVLLIG